MVHENQNQTQDDATAVQQRAKRDMMFLYLFNIAKIKYTDCFISFRFQLFSL